MGGGSPWFRTQRLCSSLLARGRGSDRRLWAELFRLVKYCNLPRPYEGLYSHVGHVINWIQNMMRLQRLHPSSPKRATRLGFLHALATCFALHVAWDDIYWAEMVVGEKHGSKISGSLLLLEHELPCFEYSCGFLNVSLVHCSATMTIIIIIIIIIIVMFFLPNFREEAAVPRFACPRSGALFHHHGLCTSKPATRLAHLRLGIETSKLYGLMADGLVNDGF